MGYVFGGVFLDGTAFTKGCRCGVDCEMPCWQRVGLGPACASCGCAPFCFCGVATPDSDPCPRHGAPA